MAASNVKASAAMESAEHELVITRLFDAPRELVFECWTKPEHLQRWQGAPRGFKVTSQESDIRPGGFFRICMRSPEGIDHWLRGGYREIVKPERLVFTHVWLDANRKPGKETLVTITLADRGGKTELTLRQTGFPSVESCDGHKYGWTSALDVLTDYLAEAARAIVVTRVFDAPRNLVWKAFTERERLIQWWGPKGFSMRTANLDLRPGGVFHYCMRSPDGRDMWGKFAYREIVAPERLVFVNSFSDVEGKLTRHPMSPSWPLEVLNTMTLSEHDGKTTLSLHGVPINATEEECKTFEAGRQSMQQGFKGTLDQLADYLAKA